MGDKECCTGDIIDTGIICGNGNVAPCIIDSSVTTTSSPEVSPSQAPTSSPSTAKPVSGSEAPAAAPQPPTAPTASVGPSAAPQLPVAQVPTGAPAAVAAPTVAPVVAPTVVVKVTNAPSKPTVAPAAAESPSVATGVTSAPFGGEGCGILGSADCCFDNIIAAQLVCGVDVFEAPCIVDDDVLTPTPTPTAQGETAPPTTLPPITAPVSPNPTAQPAPSDVSAAPATSPTGSPVMSRGNPTTAPMPGASVTEMPVAPEQTLAPHGPTSPPEADITPSTTEEETCSNGLPGYQHGVVCCPLACGQCGGSGCENIAGTAGASDCCSDIILAADVDCDPTAIVPVVAPCIVGTVDEVEIANDAINAATGLRTGDSIGSGSTASFIGVACAVAVAAATTARFTR
eukprot:jgi/Undpi1/5917/HiC_scaffold_2.g01191.m1